MESMTLKPTDYFVPGMTTVLNSEVACMRRVYEIS
jgi:hypothetical protein